MIRLRANFWVFWFGSTLVLKIRFRFRWPRRVQEVKAPRFLDTRHMKVVRSWPLSTWYSFLEAESTPGKWTWRMLRKKSPVTRPGIDPGTFRLVPQRLNHYATTGPFWGTVNFAIRTLLSLLLSCNSKLSAWKYLLSLILHSYLKVFLYLTYVTVRIPALFFHRTYALTYRCYYYVWHTHSNP